MIHTIKCFYNHIKKTALLLLSLLLINLALPAQAMAVGEKTTPLPSQCTINDATSTNRYRLNSYGDFCLFTASNQEEIGIWVENDIPLRAGTIQVLREGTTGGTYCNVGPITVENPKYWHYTCKPQGTTFRLQNNSAGVGAPALYYTMIKEQPRR